MTLQPVTSTSSPDPLSPHRLRVLYICYASVTAPLVHTQVIAYLSGLACCGYKIHLLTFEPKKLSGTQTREWRRHLKDQGILWHHLPYHKRPTVPATIYDVCRGVIKGLKLIRRYRINAVHARSHVAAFMGLVLKKLTGCGLIFDIRGLLAEEYEDAGQWKRAGLPFRLTKDAERRCIAAADSIVVLTARTQSVISLPLDRMNVIPCCTDVEGISCLSKERDALRRELGIQDKTVLVYSGQLGTWYLASEMVDFFVMARQTMPQLHFLILTPSESHLIHSKLEAQGISDADYTIMSVAPERVGAYLGAADCAISFIKPCLSKIASSPTKIGEYLAAGLPVVSNTGIGDLDALLRDVGVLVPDFGPVQYQIAVRQLILLLENDDVQARCRERALARLSLNGMGIPSYARVYQSLTRAHNRE